MSFRKSSGMISSPLQLRASISSISYTKLYADFELGEFCKIYWNEEFMYREYTAASSAQLCHYPGAN